MRRDKRVIPYVDRPRLVLKQLERELAMMREYAAAVRANLTRATMAIEDLAHALKRVQDELRDARTKRSQGAKKGAATRRRSG